MNKLSVINAESPSITTVPRGPARPKVVIRPERLSTGMKPIRTARASNVAHVRPAASLTSGDRISSVRWAMAVLLGLAATACGEVPPLDVTVFDASSKVAFKGSLSANSTFATGNLHPGNYVVQFNTKSAAVKRNRYLLVVSA